MTERMSKNMSSTPEFKDFSHKKPLAQIQSNPHFARIGGEAAIRQLVDRFYHYMDALPEAADIRALHEPDLTHTKAVLVKFLIEWLGGPKTYSPERGHPRLRMKHSMFAIGPAERDAWMLCMTRAMDDVVSNAELRRELHQAFFKTADFIRNDQGSTHA
jgi:hemoglobin